MKRILLLAVSLLAVLAAGWAQCPDFTNLSEPGVFCRYGPYENPTMNTGIVEGRHTVVTQQGMDPHTGYQLPILPPGETAVVKLGNDLGGKQSECIDYDFVVDPDNPILTVKFAFVLQNFGEMSSGCPMFCIYLLGQQSGDSYAYGSIYPCGHYYFPYPFFGNFQVAGSVIWRPWTTISIDLSQHAGQQVRARFITYDSKFNNASFGYAYFTASCMSDRLTVVGCDGEQITLAAPEGYVHYDWNNGSTSVTSTYPLQDNLDVLCHVSSDPGIDCDFYFDLNSIEGMSLITNETWYDTICEGESYSGHGFDLPPQESSGEFTFSRTVLDPGNCLSGNIYKLHLTVIQRNEHYYATVCEGTDYDQYGFHYTNLQAGIFTDSLPLTTENGCFPAYKYLHLTVNPHLEDSGELFGDTAVCDMTVNTYMLNCLGPISLYQWDVPEGVTNYSNTPGQSVHLYFTENSPNPAVISVTGTNACGSYTLTKTVYHTPAYHIIYEDTVCVGVSYNSHGIQTPLLDNPGLYYLSYNGTTVNGCDSDVMVRLVVNPTPTLTTLAQPEDLCAGESTIVLAVGDHGAIVPHNPQQVVPGDILCTDNTIVKPAEWPVPGKTAKAVVYFVDSTGQHGWAVHLQDQGSFPWGTAYLPASSGMTGGYVLEPQYFLDGKINTQKLRLYGSATDFPAVWAVDFDNGWYLPAVGQLIFLFYELSAVNESLSLVNGSPFLPPFSSSSTPDAFILDSYMSNCYWSITPNSFSNPNIPLPENNPASPYFVDFFSLTLISGVPGVARKVRSIIDF